MKKNTGRFSKAEVLFIEKNCKILSADEIAEQLNRDILGVKNYLVKKLGVVPVNKVNPIAQIKEEMKRMPEWEVLARELSQEELDYFKHRFTKIMGQFKDDILVTEETQIFLLIRYEILMQRNMKDAKRSVSEIERLEGMVNDLYAEQKDETDEKKKQKNRDLIFQFTDSLHAAKAATTSKSTEYVKLTEKHSSILKELKATRDQRVSKTENAKETFLDLMKAMQVQEFRNRESKNLDLIRLAASKETDRLSALHNYIDNEADRPLLTPETVLLEDEKT